MQTNSKGKMCPRECGGRLLPSTPYGFNPNAKSKIDGLYICMDCFMKEIYGGVS